MIYYHLWKKNEGIICNYLEKYAHPIKRAIITAAAKAQNKSIASLTSSHWPTSEHKSTPKAIKQSKKIIINGFDGNHRLDAYKKLGIKEIPIIVNQSGILGH